ncbi:MAG: hypothetical protein JJU02_15530, partial [Cryomorphaceae bacterium]|nr:hypothetical protein [Cryomorphaceae bacterium]
QYVGKERDGESGLYYYGARCYADWLCRFVSVDPLKDDYPYYTTYQYAGNKPITSIDVDGLEAENQVEEEEVGQQDTPANVNNKFIVLQSSKTGENYALPLHNLQEVDITADKPIATFGELAILSLHVYPDASDTVVLEGFKPVSEAELEKLGLTIDKGFVLSHKDSGFNSQLYSRTVEGKKQYVYAFQGTDFYENNKDMETNANQILTGKAHQYAIAVKNARMLKEKLNENLMFTGHSLGGGLASIAALFTGLSAVTFNAAAISEKTKDKYNLNNVSDDRIIAFHVKGEVVTEGQSLIDLKAEGFPITLDAKYIPIIPIGKVMILVTSSLQAKQKIKNHSMYQVIKRMKAEGYM